MPLAAGYLLPPLPCCFAAQRNRNDLSLTASAFSCQLKTSTWPGDLSHFRYPKLYERDDAAWSQWPLHPPRPLLPPPHSGASAISRLPREAPPRPQECRHHFSVDDAQEVFVAWTAQRTQRYSHSLPAVPLLRCCISTNHSSFVVSLALPWTLVSHSSRCQIAQSPWWRLQAAALCVFPRVDCLSQCGMTHW